MISTPRPPPFGFLFPQIYLQFSFYKFLFNWMWNSWLTPSVHLALKGNILLPARPSQKKHSHFIYESFKRTIPHKLLLWNILQQYQVSVFWTACKEDEGWFKKFFLYPLKALPRCFFYFSSCLVGWKLINSSSGMKICFNIPFL